MLSIKDGDSGWSHYVSRFIIEEMRNLYELGIDEREAQKLVIMSFTV